MTWAAAAAAAAPQPEPREQPRIAGATYVMKVDAYVP